VAVTVEGEVEPGSGWLVDFADIDAVVAPLIAELDHRLLNEVAGLDNPTSELLAAWLWQRLRPRLPLLVELSVAETAHSRCIYRGE
jgi:6-pyruvoyltetrahydropterin/6-carboxytetrahydropterin synthase